MMHWRASLVQQAHIAALLVLALNGCSSVSAPRASGPAPSAGGTGFAAAASTQLWLQQFGTGTVLADPPAISPTTGLFHGGDVLTGVAVDSSGNAILSGYTRGAFPGFTNPSQTPQDFVAKFDPSGKQLWLRQFGSGASDYLNAVAADANGNIFAAGFTTGSFTTVTANGSPLAVAVKLDANGNQIWLRQFAAGTGIAIRAVAAGAGGTLLVAGVLNQTTAQPQAGQIQLKSQSAFVAMLDSSSGQTLWQQTVDPAAISILSAIAVDSAGNALAAGEAIQTSANPSSPEIFQLLAIKLAADDGSTLWQQENIGGSSSASAALLTGIAVDDRNNAVVVGSEFGGTAESCVLAKLDTLSGQPVWITPFSGTTLTAAGTVAVDATGNIFTAGNTLAALVPNYQPNLQDVYVAKFNSAGQSQWVQQFGMLQETLVPGDVNYTVGPLPQGYWPQIATDASGYTLVGGITRGQFPGFSNPHGAVEPFLAKFAP